MKRFPIRPLSTAFAGGLILTACSDDLSPPPSVPPPSAVYAPSQGVVPVPSDLLFSGTQDLTFQIPGVDGVANPTATPVEIALAGLDGWSPVAPITLQFNTALDATTLVAGGTVRIFEVTLDTSTVPVGGPVNSVVSELAAGTDFTVGLAPEITTGSSVRVYFEAPLKPATSYMVVMTDGVTSLTGVPLEKTGEYLLASSPTPYPANGSINPPINALWALVNSHLVAAEGQGIARDNVVFSNVFTTQDIHAVLNGLTAVVGGGEAGVIALICGNVPSGCAGEATTVAPTNTSTLTMNQTSVITTADALPGSPGLADLYTGELTIPYYLTAANNPSDTAPVSDAAPLIERMQARFPFFTGDTVKHVTSYNVLPATTGQETIPVLVAVPNGTSGQSKPVGGWPTVIFQHGITRSRLDMIAMADSFANAGIMVVAIDLPLHGYDNTSDPVLFAGYDKNAGGARERTFGLDLLDAQGAGIPDGVVDSSGAPVINLATLLVARDNMVQATSDLLHLSAKLPGLDYDGGGADVDATRMHFVGHSLGGMIGMAFLRQSAPNIQSATFAMSGGGIAKLLDGSQSFGPVLQAGLGAAGVNPGTADYEAFLWGAQTAVDRMDPLSYAADVAASGLPIHFMEVIGGGPGGGLPDATIPNTVPFAPLSGSTPLIDTLGLTQVTADIPSGGAIQGVVRFIEGSHQSLISPSPSAAAFGEMQAQSVEFAATSGTTLTLVDESVIETTP
ncbi:MAG: hypothetical protein R3E96_05525 [Planctomycetota bacterium]